MILKYSELFCILLWFQNNGSSDMTLFSLCFLHQFVRFVFGLDLRYSPCLLVAILWLLLSTDAYPTHSTDFGCFPCRCKQVAPGSKELISCGLAGVLKLKDVSLSKQEISSVGMYAFRSLGLIQRLSLQGNQISVLPKKIFAPLRGLQLLDLAHLGLERVESETFLGY